MSQHAKQLHSFLPADRVSSHRGHIITLPVLVTPLFSWWRIAGGRVAITEAVKDPFEVGQVPGAEGISLPYVNGIVAEKL